MCPTWSEPGPPHQRGGAGGAARALPGCWVWGGGRRAGVGGAGRHAEEGGVRGEGRGEERRRGRICGEGRREPGRGGSGGGAGEGLERGEGPQGVLSPVGGADRCRVVVRLPLAAPVAQAWLLPHRLVEPLQAAPLGPGDLLHVAAQLGHALLEAGVLHDEEGAAPVGAAQPQQGRLPPACNRWKEPVDERRVC